MFKVRRREPVSAPAFDPFRRLKNLEKARTRVILQLANPLLAEMHRPQILAKLSSLQDEIAQLRRATSPTTTPKGKS
jgi:hypothetical protein